MMKPGPKSFPLRNGQCQIFSDRLEIHQSGLTGWLYRWLFKRGILRVLPLYILLALGFLFFAIIAIYITNYFLALFLGVFAVLSLLALARNRNVSLAPLIARREIEKVIFKPAVEGVSRATFLIYFRPKGQLLRRTLLLPSRMQEGAQIANAAYWMMRDEGLVE